MKKEYQLILDKSKSRYAANSKFLTLLAKRKIAGFDKTVHDIHEKVFKTINCMECANCCRKLGPLFNETDLERISSLFRLKRNEFISRYLIVDEDGDLVFKGMPCPFLGDDSLCTIYEERPRACKQYPHTEEKNIQNRLKRLLTNTLYCPAAVLITDQLREQYE